MSTENAYEREILRIRDEMYGTVARINTWPAVNIEGVLCSLIMGMFEAVGVGDDEAFDAALAATESVLRPRYGEREE